MSIHFKSALGGDPIRRFDAFLELARPTEGDAIAIANNQRTRILQRTARGVDANGAAFAAYSSIGPIYIDLGRGGAARTTVQKISATKRFLKKVGFPAANPIRKASQTARAARKSVRAKASPAKLRKISGVTPMFGITPGGLLKVPSYAAFKFQALGRSVVDLFGHRAPHMLQALVVRLNGSNVKSTPSPTDRKRPARQATLGFYGQEAARAKGNNARRRFFDFGYGDTDSALTLLRKRIQERVRSKVA